MDVSELRRSATGETLEREDLNDDPVATSLLNGTSAVKDVFSFQVKGRYLRMRARNESGASLAASGNTLRYVAGAVDQA